MISRRDLRLAPLTLVGQRTRSLRFIPAILDHLAARMAWDGQLYGGAPDPDQAVDLYEPVPGRQATHGVFDTRARDHSWELGLTLHASRLATAASDAAGVIIRALSSDQGSAPSAHTPRSQNGQHGQRPQQPIPAH